MTDTPHDDRESRPIDAQPVRTGELSADEKLDIALQGSMMTSEPPQLSEPKTAAAEHGDEAAEARESDDDRA